jgi:hypothetical protein
METLASRSRHCNNHANLLIRFMGLGALPASVLGSNVQHGGYRHWHFCRSLSHHPPRSSSSDNQTSNTLRTEKHTDEPIVPQIPLCERSPAHSTQLISLLAWREMASQRATFAGTKWEAAGEADAPSVEDLHTELSWLLDDVVAGVRESPSATWQQKSWRDIERVEAAAEVAVAEMHLRESLEKLGTF